MSENINDFIKWDTNSCSLQTQDFPPLYLLSSTFVKRHSGHMAVCRPSVTSHLYILVDGDTWGRVKVQFGTGCLQALINTSFLSSVSLLEGI